MLGFRRATLRIPAAGLMIAAGLATPAMAASAVPDSLAQSQTPACVVSASPYTFIESGLSPQPSSVAYIVTVECKPTYSEQSVEIYAPQLSNACQGLLKWYNVTSLINGDATVTLDDDGNATVIVLGGPSCTAGRDLIEADLAVAPYTTATTVVQIAPPVDTLPGVSALPASEVEDATTSSAATIFYVEFPSVYAGREVEIGDAELHDSCAGHITWILPNSTTLEYGKSVTTTLDDNGNAFVVALAGPSCAPETSLVQADLVGPPYTTFTTQFTVLSPRVTVGGKRRTQASSNGLVHSRPAGPVRARRDHHRASPPHNGHLDAQP
jgi:hypothetical protein